MARSLKDRLALKAFFGLWGGWTVMAVLIAIVLPKFLFNANQTAGGIVVLALFAVLMAIREKLFRRRLLPPVAQRLWHAWLVLIPLFVAGLLPKYAHLACQYVPGGLRYDATFVYWGPPDTAGERPVLFNVDMELRNAGWGPQVTPRTAEIKTTPAWSVSCLDGYAHGSERSIKMDPEGLRTLASEVAPGLSDDVQSELAFVMGDHLLRGIHPIPGSTEMEITVLSVTTGTAPVPWTLLGALLFSALLLPVTWFVVRFTMFPSGVPLQQ